MFLKQNNSYQITMVERHSIVDGINQIFTIYRHAEFDKIDILEGMGSNPIRLKIYLLCE